MNEKSLRSVTKWSVRLPLFLTAGRWVNDDMMQSYASFSYETGDWNRYSFPLWEIWHPSRHSTGDSPFEWHGGSPAAWQHSERRNLLCIRSNLLHLMKQTKGYPATCNKAHNTCCPHSRRLARLPLHPIQRIIHPQPLPLFPRPSSRSPHIQMIPLQHRRQALLSPTPRPHIPLAS